MSSISPRTERNASAKSVGSSLPPVLSLSVVISSPHLSIADPTLRDPLLKETSHSSNLSSSRYFPSIALNSRTTLLISSAVFLPLNLRSRSNLSTLLTKSTGLTSSFIACLVTVSVWTIMPSIESTTITAPSVSLRPLVT